MMTTTTKSATATAFDLNKLFDKSEMWISLIGILDFENEDDNPVEDKYRTLAHDILRGLVDPALKPDREQRARLAMIINSPSHHPTREEKDLLWRFRFSLVDNRRALTKFLLAVDWTVESEVIQAAELLEQWRKRSPIEVTDALKLLGKNVGFRTSLVRAYAIDTLAAAPDEELALYLLQLVQALKYEDASTDHPQSSTAREMGSSSIVTVSGGGVSSLASFLIDRASNNLNLANYLYWYLKVELQKPTYGERYRIVFAALGQKLSSTPVPPHLQHSSKSGLASPQSSFRSPPTELPLSPVKESATELFDTTRTSEKAPSSFLGSLSSFRIKSHEEQTPLLSLSAPVIKSQKSKIKSSGERTMWDVLLSQDQFISGIMDCQMNGRDTKGKKDVKEAHLREILASRGFRRIANQEAVPLPSAPDVFVTGVNPVSARMFKSALYPAVIEFCVRENVSKKKKKKKKEEKEILKEDEEADQTDLGTIEDTGISTNNTYKVIVKTGDDLRQDQLVIMMIRLMDGLLKRGTLDLCLKPYSIIATSPTTGLVEYVEGSIPISQILATHNNSILQYFRMVSPSKTAKYGISPEVMQAYVRSCAGYCVITYLLGVGDRHLDNIMLLPTGHFFHIDFGFIFGRDPKPLPPPFRLTREMVDGMGGVDSTEYQRFCTLSCQAYNLLRKNAGLVLNLLELMTDAGIEDLSNNPAADAEGIIAKMEERFRLELTDEQAESFFLGLIGESLAALAPRVMDVFHSFAVSRR